LLSTPNLVTLFRLFLTPFVALDIWDGFYGRAIALFLVAGLTDIADGLLARKMGEATQAGAYLDPIADKILLTAIYLSLGLVHAMPWWIVALVFGRDLLILSMAAYGLLFDLDAEEAGGDALDYAPFPDRGGVEGAAGG